MPTPATRLLAAFFDSVYRPLKLRGKSSQTVRLYRNTLANFDRFLHRPSTIDDLTEDTICAFMGWHTDRGHSAHTANKDGGQLMALARLAFRKRVLEIEPDVSMLPAPVRVPMAWMPDELPRLFEAARLEPGYIDGVPARMWWRALFLVLFYSAERVAAVMSINWSNVNLQRGWLIIPAEFRKGKRSDKAYQLPSVAVDALHTILVPKRDKVFPWPHDIGTLYNRLKRINKRAGLPTDRVSMFHRMRRTTASLFKQAGGDPSELLDHADPKTTKRYLDPRLCSGKSAADLLFDPTR